MIFNWELFNDNKFIIGIVLSFFLLILLMITFFQKNRIKWASMFGRSEHFCGRLLGVMLILTFFIEYFKLEYTLYFIIADFFIWGSYLISHTIEKALYPSNFRF